MERFARSWRLTMQSARVLLADKELMILPILSGLVILVLCASFLAPVFFVGEHARWSVGEHGYQIGVNVPTLVLFVLYVISYTVSIFFQCAIVAGASQRLAGGEPTLASALGAAWRRMPSIFAWGIVAATVGMILQAISERSGLLGKIVVALVGAAWSLATYFVVPVLVLEERTMGDTFKRSLQIVREKWGEAAIGGAGIGLAALFLFWLPLFALVGLVAYAGLTIVAIVIGVLGAAAGVVFFGTLQSVYLASLYRYATVGEAPAGFDGDDFAAAFRTKK